VIELTPGLPSKIIIARASGTVTADDYERVLMPAVSAAAGNGDKMRLVYVLGEDFDGFEVSAALDDAKLGLQHWSDFERIAVVTDREPYRGLIKAFGFLIPGEVRVFDLADLDAAEAWIGEH
jgi:hypothetical protein